MSTPSSTELTNEDRDLLKVIAPYTRLDKSFKHRNLIDQYISEQHQLHLDLKNNPSVKIMERICKNAVNCKIMIVVIPEQKRNIKKYIDLIPFATNVQNLSIIGFVRFGDEFDYITDQLDDLMSSSESKPTELILEALRYMRNLQKITISCNYGFNNLQELILCEHLKSLAVHAEIFDSFEYILQIPNLEHLEIGMECFGNPIPFDVRDRTDKNARREYINILKDSTISYIDILYLDTVTFLQNLRYLPHLKSITVNANPSKYYKRSLESLERVGIHINYREDEDAEGGEDEDEYTQPSNDRRMNDEDEDEDEDVIEEDYESSEEQDAEEDESRRRQGGPIPKERRI
jgi:hypothetical protein